MNSINKILVVISGTEHSYIASLYSVYLASLLKAQLIGIYVINEKALNDLLNAKIFLTQEKVDYEKEMQDDAERYLSQFEASAMKKNIPVTKVIKTGVVHSEIINYAREQEVDLIIIGELKKIISVKDVAYDEMERVLREAKIPVVVVKNKERAEMLYKNL